MHRPRQLILKNFLSHKDSTFTFKKGKAMLLVGQNNDKEGQRGNGAGKSGIPEGLSIAIAGATIRDGLTREFVARGETEAEITLIFDNLRTGKDLIITRKIFSSQTKSSTCEIKKAGVEIKKSDINEYNKFIFQELGITRDDFYNFYLLTKEKYVPFLSTPDAKKKEIVNRFSGANSVDETKPFIDKDSEDKQQEIVVIEKSIDELRGRATLLSEQLQEEKEKVSDSKIQEQVDEINSSILRSDSIIFQKRHDIIRVGGVIRSLVGERKLLLEPPHIVEGLVQVDKRVLKFSNMRTTLSNTRKDLSSFEQEIKDIEEVEKEANEELSGLKELKDYQVSDMQKLELELTTLTGQIQGAITCPKCSHEFSIRYKDFNIDQAKKRVEVLTQNSIPKAKLEVSKIGQEIIEYSDIFKGIDQQKENVNTKIKSYRSGIDKQISRIDNLIDIVNSTKESLLSDRRLFTQKFTAFRQKVVDSFSDFKRYSSTLKTELKVKGTLEQNLLSLQVVDNSKIKDLETKILTAEKEQEQLVLNLQVKVNEKVVVDEWITNFKSFKSFLANQSIKNISDYTNLFLNAIRSNITIDIEGYKTLSNKKLKEEITTTVMRDGFPMGSYGMFSAGERGRIVISNVLALRELVNLNSPTGGLDMLICDEILDSVDSLGLEYLIDSLQVLEQIIIIISQNEINAVANHTITIEKTNGVSTIIES